MATKLQIQDMYETKTLCQCTILFTLREIQTCKDQTEKNASTGITPPQPQTLLGQNCKHLSVPQTPLVLPGFSQIAHANTKYHSY